ncbi:hypothetical protein HZB60_07895 [candidate division KSB1 bacterium]|nr:hypothetical protein [candidate division KSB1 bacterium]
MISILFWPYYVIVLIAALFISRVALRESNWRIQASAALALIPLLLRALLVK